MKSGFKLFKFLKLTDWKILDMNEHVPIVSNLLCPADNNMLQDFCTLAGQNGNQKIRIGYCKNCGYMGYIDRPTKEWIFDFYFSKWDQKRNQDSLIKELKNRPSSTKGGLWRIGALDKKYNFDKNKCVLDLGCGYGKQLKIFKDIGFEKLVGVENSTYRAEVAQKAYGFQILASPFEDAQSALKALSPIGLIYSHHVLEHTYNPDEVIKLASSLQESGDYLLFAVPNVFGEVSLSILLFLPHLHSFTPTAIEYLMNKYSYEIIDNVFTTNEEIYILARKSKDLSKRQITNNEYKNLLVSKFTKGLALKDYDFEPRLFWCNRGYKRGKEESGQIRNNIISRNCFYLKNRNKSILAAVVGNLQNRNSESPIEIQFEGNIKLAYK